MMKKFKMLIELVAQTETENGSIGVTESVKMMRAIGDVAKKHKFDCYAKWYPKEVIDYIPTGKKYEIKTVEDIAMLTSEQFEMLIDDLRSYCNVMRDMKPLIDAGLASNNPWMTWLDTWLNTEEIKFQVNISNKM